MAAFLTAEHLAQHSVSESQIQNAMDQAQRNQQMVTANKPSQKSEYPPPQPNYGAVNERLPKSEWPSTPPHPSLGPFTFSLGAILHKWTKTIAEKQRFVQLLQ